MVADPGAAVGADRLRPLNAPRPVVVEADADGRPLVLTEQGRRLEVAAIRDRWLVEEEWWRTPVARRYLEVVLADGSVRTIYTDIVTGDWHTQSY